jgi:integrase
MRSHDKNRTAKPRKRHADGIYARGSSWWATWTENGSTRHKSLGLRATKETRALAREKYAALMRDRTNPEEAVRRDATFGDAVDGFLDDLERADRPEGTRKMYATKTANLVSFFGRDCKLVSLTPATVEDYFTKRQDEDEVSGSTMFKEWVALSRVMQRAWRRDTWKGDVKRLRPEWLTSDYEPRSTYLAWPFIPYLLAALEPPHAERVAFIIATGARWEESENFQPTDLDRTTWQIHLRGTKTKGSKRTFVVPEAMRGLLERVGGPFVRWPGVNLSLRRACRRAQMALAEDTEDMSLTPLIPRVTPNDLRRTFGSLLVQGGTSLPDVSRMMGHTSTAMVFRVYGHDTPESLAARVAVPVPCTLQPAVPPVYQTGAELTDAVDTLDGIQDENPSDSLFRRRDSNPNKRIQNPLSCH